MNAAPKFQEAIEAFQRGDLDHARSIAERELESSPSPQWQHLLGLVHCRLGKLEVGVEQLRLACEAEPENVGFRVMLVRSLVDSGRANEALEAAIPAGETSAAELALWHARAEAADAAGSSEESLEAWGKLCGAGVRDWRAWASYGEALGAAGQWPSAVQAFRRACDIEPGPPAAEARRSLAAALAQVGRQDEAADELLRWIEHAPEDAENRILVACLLADLGRDSESLEQLDKATSAATGHGFTGSADGLLAIVTGRDGRIHAWLLTELCRLLERTNRIDALRKLLGDAEATGIAREQLAYPAAALALRDGKAKEARRLLESSGPGATPLRWHRLMARIADALDDPASAFAEARAMNESVANRDEWLASCMSHIASLRAAAASINPDWGSRIRRHRRAERASPAFLVGFPRSGTTLLDTFLMGHPGMTVLEEVPLLAEAQQCLGDLVDIPDLPREQLDKAREIYFAGLDRHVDPEFDGLIIDKLPLNIIAAGFIHALFPDAKLIFAQRHPCDSVLSCIMQPFALNKSMACFLDLQCAAAFYDAAMSLWTRTAELLPLDVHTVVYEDLVADPEATLRPLVQFLGLDWHGELLDHRATAQARGAISTPSYDQVVKPLTNSAVGRWRRYEKQLAPVLPVLLPWAEQLGYEA